MTDVENARRRMEEFGEEIEDFCNRKENHCWENYDSLYMCKLLHPYIIFELSLHGQYIEEFFVRSNLKIRFPSLTFEAIDNGNDERLVVDENGNEVHQILHPLPIYKKFETMLYQELNKKYSNDPEILNLKVISSEMYKIIKNDGIGFSQEEIIAIIDRAIKAYHPGGPIWIRLPKKKKRNQKK